MAPKLKYSKFMPVTDHLGVHYDTVLSCCLAWDIPEYSFRNRFLKGWDIEKILTKERIKRKFPISDHLGNGFNSAAEMCEYYGVDYGLFQTRIHSLKMPLKEALTSPAKPLRKAFDLGTDKGFKSISDMAKAIGISRSGLYSRLERGWDICDILAVPVRSKRAPM